MFISSNLCTSPIYQTTQKMPPKPASRASKPASKANGAASSKPASRAASAKPPSTRPPTSRRGAAPVVAEDKAEPAADAGDARPAKKGRVAELSGESKPKRSRVSLNNREINEIPARRESSLCNRWSELMGSE
jgi:hypothetical protein